MKLQEYRTSQRKKYCNYYYYNHHHVSIIGRRLAIHYFWTFFHQLNTKKWTPHRSRNTNRQKQTNTAIAGPRNIDIHCVSFCLRSKRWRAFAIVVVRADIINIISRLQSRPTMAALLSSAGTRRPSSRSRDKSNTHNCHQFCCGTVAQQWRRPRGRSALYDVTNYVTDASSAAATDNDRFCATFWPFGVFHLTKTISEIAVSTENGRDLSQRKNRKAASGETVWWLKIKNNRRKVSSLCRCYFTNIETGTVPINFDKLLFKIDRVAQKSGHPRNSMGVRFFGLPCTCTELQSCVSSVALQKRNLSQICRRKLFVNHMQLNWSITTNWTAVGCVAQLAERRSLAGELTLSCARPQLTGDQYVSKMPAEDQPTGPTQPFILSGSINE